ncbi:MAG TPA: hypothetical protein VHV10_18090 [Ktedonobacteraceae bacterium]|jgi:chromosome segregation ATPase|nr:hypothetical protein [Ktedonobacteraceae bacterium]
MNNPIDHDGDLESRLEKLESGQNHLIRQAKAHELDLNQVKSTLERVQFDTGSTRESLDTIERKQNEAIRLLRGIRQTQADHGERFDELKQELHTHSEVWLKSLQENFDQVKEALVEIRTTQGTHNERFDAMATKDDIASIKATQDQILQLLQQKPPEGQP